jgi:23S rRNA (guanine745-N1)-methyltransferase
VSAALARAPLACSVRDCGEPLARKDRAFVCPRGHAFDVARSGYLNLLQPQDRRSLAAGDSRAAVEARARLFAAGIGRELVDALRARVALDDLPPVVVELGSGSGDILAAAAPTDACAVGLDLSIAAAEHAARRFPARAWVVANADRRLPLLYGSVGAVLSVNGRRNPEECLRVLAPRGRLLVVVPAGDDLAELRAAVQGKSVAKDRAPDVIAAHEGRFRLVEHVTVRTRVRLARAALLDLLAGTYRGERASVAERVAGLAALDVTLAAEILAFERV